MFRRPTEFIDRRRFLGLAGAVCLAGAGALTGCASRSEPTGLKTGAGSNAEPDVPDGGGSALQERTLFVFDTVVTLSCRCSEDLMDRAVERCEFFESRFSRTVEGSDVWHINHAGGGFVSVAAETADIIQRSLVYCERSGGLFDITIGAVSSLWDFKNGVRPDDASIAEAVRHVDYRGVHVDGSTVRLEDPEAMIDLGGVAKGYIADDLASLFREGGCASGIINLGGNAYVIGSKPDGGPWNVGVQDPNGADQAVIAKIACTDASVVTSGLYEREFTEDGVRYYHILDPATGFPAETDLISSSVFSESSLDGDAYATWMFLLGHDGALALLEGTAGLEGLVVDGSGAISMTDGAEFELL